jgi:hypothetical protein
LFDGTVVVPLGSATFNQRGYVGGKGTQRAQENSSGWLGQPGHRWGIKHALPRPDFGNRLPAPVENEFVLLSVACDLNERHQDGGLVESAQVHCRIMAITNRGSAIQQNADQSCPSNTGLSGKARL